MFTGIVKELGTLEALERGADGARLRIAAGLAPTLAEGDSVAVNGVCLTVVALREGAFEADAMNQTLALTTLGGLAPGARVNLEPALRAGERLGGHIVQGHVDGVGEIAAIEDDGFARRLHVTLPPELRPYVVDRGSVALDGVSLTVAELRDDGIEVSLIPETLARTRFGEAGAGTRVNVEVDVLARYVERLVQRFTTKGAVDG